MQRATLVFYDETQTQPGVEDFMRLEGEDVQKIASEALVERHGHEGERLNDDVYKDSIKHFYKGDVLLGSLLLDEPY